MYIRLYACICVRLMSESNQTLILEDQLCLHLVNLS